MDATEDSGNWLGKRVRRLREEAGLSQEALARAASLSTSALVRLERSGGEEARIGTLLALARALDCDLNDLVGPGPETLARRTRNKEGGAP